MSELLSKRSFIPIVLFVLSDLILAIGSGLIAYNLRFGNNNPDFYYQMIMLVFGLLSVISFGINGVHDIWRGRAWYQRIWKLFLGWAMAFGMLFAILVAFKISDSYSRIWLSFWMGTHLSLVLLVRGLFSVSIRRYRMTEENAKSVLIIGHGRSYKKIIKRFTKPNEDGFLIKDRIKFESLEQTLAELKQRIDDGLHFDGFWICLPLKYSAAVKDIVHELRHETGNIRFMPGIRDLPLINHQVTPIGGIYSLDISISPMDDFNRLVKRLEDIVLSSIILVLISPVCLMVAAAIKLTSPGPVLFKQYRHGRNKEKIKVYKFRSMKVHDEAHGRVTQATKGDSRITKVGAFLRRTSLDELPQFLNVLQGRMSIVGPRPHALAHNEEYKELVQSYMKRHKIKPGITGLAQVKGYRGETDTLDKMEKRVEYDLKYINEWSLWLDIKIVFLTIFKGFAGNTAY